jgi:hypothetical protein
MTNPANSQKTRAIHDGRKPGVKFADVQAGDLVILDDGMYRVVFEQGRRQLRRWFVAEPPAKGKA